MESIVRNGKRNVTLWRSACGCGFLVLLAACLVAFAPAGGHADSSARLLVDQAGRQVAVPADPVRVVALAPSVTEIIFELGEQRRLRGVTQFSDYPPPARDLPKVGSYVKLDLERIVSLNPDLCIAIKDGNPIRTVERIEALAIPVYAVDPRDLNGVINAIGEIGVLLNAGPKAENLVNNLRSRIDRVESRVKNLDHRPGVFFQIGIKPIVAVGTHSFSNELIVMAGGRNLTAGPVAYPRFNVEQVLDFNPEVIVITTMAREGGFEEARDAWTQWGQIPAVKNRRVHVVDSDLYNRPGPRLVAGLEQLASLLHPELFGENP